jgi:hypothetical protein
VLLYGSAEERYARLKDNTRKLAETIRNLGNDIQQYTTAASIKLDMASAQIQAIGRAADASAVMLEMKRSLDVMTESMNVTTQFVSDTQIFFRTNLDTLIKDLDTFDETTTTVLEQNLAKSKEVEEARIKAAIDKAVKRADGVRRRRQAGERVTGWRSRVTVVALHTQALVSPEADSYLNLSGARCRRRASTTRSRTAGCCRTRSTRCARRCGSACTTSSTSTRAPGCRTWPA